MDNVKPQATSLLEEIEAASHGLNLPKLRAQSQDLIKQSQTAGFWQAPDAAQATMKELSDIQTRIKPWEQLISSAKEVVELANLNDPALYSEINSQIKKIRNDLEGQKTELKFSGPHDNNAAILSIYAGAGGTDAQDWAGLLLRMYSRWAEKQKLKLKILDQSGGEEAGIKSATIEIAGPLAYGRLKGEHGVHRLVRLSPYNADQKRHTSFAKVEVLPEIGGAGGINIDDKDLKIDVFRAGGHGGQSVNTTDSAVRVTHLPTAISVTIQNERSQLQNRETALTILRSRLAKLIEEQHKEKLEEIKGPNQSAEWGNQIRSYVMHPYKQVKDLRTQQETSDAQGVLDGNLDPFIEAYLNNL